MARGPMAGGALRATALLCCLSASGLLAAPGKRGQRGGEAPPGASSPPGEIYDSAVGQAMVEKGLGNEEGAWRRLSVALMTAPNVSVAWYEFGLLLGARGATLDADRSLQAAQRLERDPAGRAAKARQELRARGGAFEPAAPFVELGDGGGEGLSAEQRAAREHQSRYKRKLYERYYELDVSVRRHAQALTEGPDNPATVLAAARLYTELLEHSKAVGLYRRAAELLPDDASVFIRQMDAQVKGCVFDAWDANFAKLAVLIKAQAARGEEPSLGPIQSTVYPLPPDVALAICKFLGAKSQRAVDAVMRTPLPLDWAPRGGVLRLAYVTSHFTSSSIGREMLFLLSAHDPARFSVACFALNSDEGSWLQHTWREHIARACGSFVDLSASGDGDAAAAINRAGVHVLMDLNGWSGGHREDIIARRPAPVQVNYKNWVASSGIPNLHYNIGDKVACPPEYQGDYTEGLVLVPNSYFISGHKFQYPLTHPIQAAAEVGARPGARARARAEHGLPRDDFLVANFNNLDKLEPRIWRMWRQMVESHEGVSLWLQKYPPAKADRVRQLAEEEGGKLPHRLTLTPFFSSNFHISIKALGDVFADNPTYNAHSTAMDTLWGGLPLCTLPEEKMSARVGASLLLALGRADGIARDLDDMRGILGAMVERPGRAREARRRLEEARFTQPLFDTVRAVRNLEVAFRLMFEASLEGDRPMHKRFQITTVDVMRGGADEPELEKKLHSLRVETADAEKV